MLYAGRDVSPRERRKTEAATPLTIRCRQTRMSLTREKITLRGQRAILPQTCRCYCRVQQPLRNQQDENGAPRQMRSAWFTARSDARDALVAMMFV